MSIYASAVKKPITTALVFVTIVILGLFSLSRLPIDLLPEIETNTILVMTAYPGASASDIEMNVSKPMENVMNSVSNLKNLTSQSKENMSIVVLEFEYGTDIDVATNDVRDKLDMVESSLPDDVENPIIFKFGTDDLPVMILSVTADESTNALYKILDDKVSNPLARISGVGAVSISGTAVREVQVYCDPYKLEAYDQSIENVANIIAMENRNTPGGTVDIGSNTYSLRVQGEFTDSRQMLNLVIGSKDGKPVYLRDVARVEDSIEERAQEAFNNGAKGGMIIIQKQSGANSVDISKKIKERLPELQKELPSDVELGVIIDTSDNILNTIDSLVETIMITFVIVMLVVFIFLGRWRATFIIVLTIPISLIGAFIYLLMSGNTLNIISLSSLSIAIGMVVDDAIVVLENVTKHIENGSKPKQAAVYATNEVAISVIASTLTMLAVFLPLTMVSGMAGVLFKQLGWIVSIIMIISTAAALTLTPMLCSQLLKLDPKKGKLYTLFFTPIERALGALDRGYGKLLYWAVHHRAVVVVVAIAIFGSSMLLVPTLKTEFFPTMDNARIGVTVELPIGTRQEITRDLALRIDESFRQKYPEIRITNFSEGQASTDNTFAQLSDNGSHIISFNIALYSISERLEKSGSERSMSEICDLMRQDLAMYPEIKTYEVLAGGSKISMGGESSIDIEIYGFDFEETDRIANEVSQRMLHSAGCSQTSISRGDYIPEYQIDFDREKLALNGLNVTTASMYLRNRINGSIASQYREDGDEYDIRVWYAPEYRQSLEDIENIVIYNNDGEGVRIRDLGQVTERMTPPTIERKNRERVITITAVAAKGAALSDLVDVATEELNSMDLPSDITWQLAGSYEDQQDVFNELYVLLVLIVILVYIVMAAQFESLVDPFVIMFSIPFALTGVVLGLSITQTPLGVMALIGLIMLMGIVVKNGIVLVDYTILCRERGMSVLTAVVAAGKSRLRPVLMTTLTTVLGMIPMAVGTGEGAEMWRSMGMTVAWGLSVSTLITLVLIPTIYSIFAGNGIKRKRRQLAKIEHLEAL
ncbi:HAE1 family hydrophobic/amphiphilic exporter-1 [Parabacteroides sp. PF5-5]|uniref:efflux RND transporter permease subunit n=1 Tax=unclassified Parabacteroides TaxID=2649774 RepID=UPI002472FA87|nr:MULTISPECIES: efflux RND transporter permease subunit [unclassified Parabacteroides]MDH6304880.1 HAE1 family hydrophobic/amphiphilic exporter-1 [Parabacteroides sp. PH5-39]MDH6316034.1 HAE1 family hydrophobic/amphiphilic exporter-1 [Parabacteroides sp. PF5-13]MDH6319691.1 HAE1 family hydrophobic/amphiphilic exporter-1 [Parabacteroides sp. PH5-13]MDH6323422.1 HAE1 family hydrophobic/amphiphilic exporter-1 [Parabacteroides sp. PH5-8]MDH6327069.1 HAE1 family hydrophobic/amphiphilic exporter-1 